MKEESFLPGTLRSKRKQSPTPPTYLVPTSARWDMTPFRHLRRV